MRWLCFTSAVLLLVGGGGCNKSKTAAGGGAGGAGFAIGQVAPEISGEDVDGKPMKLSDYRGKVVVLDFWGNW
jgi:hypothetical protein